MNEAIFMTDAEIDAVNEVVKQFTQIVDSESLFVKTEPVTYTERQTGVKILTCSDRYADDAVICEREFVKSPCTESWDAFLDKVRAYLFTIAADMAMNA